MAPSAENLVPFAEPAWLAGHPSPYYKETHKKFQRACRAFFDEHLNPYAIQWENEGDVPQSFFEIVRAHNMLIPNLPAPLPVKWLKEVHIDKILCTPVEEWDYLHSGIYLDEMARSGLMGPIGSMMAGHAFAIPAITKFGGEALKEKFLPDLLTARKRACIAVTEPSAGSDVANLNTTAIKSRDGEHYIVNGQKKWITNGCWADYGVMAVRTGGPGPSGLSVIVCPLVGHPGVTIRRMKVGGGRCAGTAFIDLDDVKVPAENLIGEEGLGMKYVMTNFNHERLTICCQGTRQARVALSSAFAYTMKRKAFGKPLIEQPVVRHRLAKAAAELEAHQAWIEQFLYSMTELPRAKADTLLGGLTALAKAKTGIVFTEAVQVAMLLFGGNGYTTSGQGELIEKLYREAPGTRIPGGSEDVMLDLAIRQLLKNYKAAMKELEKPKQGKL